MRKISGDIELMLNRRARIGAFGYATTGWKAVPHHRVPRLRETVGDAVPAVMGG